MSYFVSLSDLEPKTASAPPPPPAPPPGLAKRATAWASERKLLVAGLGAAGLYYFFGGKPRRN